MITLTVFPPMFGETSASSFSTKAIYLMTMAGVPWTRENSSDPRKWPKGKLPAITVDGKVIGDSDGIRAYLEAQGADFDKGLSDLEKSTSRGLIRMAEDHLYYHVMLDRWADDAVWPTIRDAYFADIPKPLRGLITGGLRRNVMKGMHVQGLGRLSPEERLARANQDLEAITTRLWEGPFLFGEQPTLADACVAPVLGGLRSTPVATLLSKRVSEDAVLGAYIDRVDEALGQKS
ncbi:hypothetical protein ASD8599_00048 [Ascidiaceihabitans donghaensis]|uniref:Thioredoxin-like fold domain-containing protein n=1 Tax=Ascidiaceihabitans donghaensis TaxID=1510460 RepID=A0A2R8B8H2_9RHOB|nr:glutathione S-transferase family protein [Ascidiaceihabitans donghaensis]SPH19323.1 hypothetical protein ASD8599_00048 [Ascidiaceihabitans donghaensis]